MKKQQIKNRNSCPDLILLNWYYTKSTASFISRFPLLGNYSSWIYIPVQFLTKRVTTNIQQGLLNIAKNLNSPKSKDHRSSYYQLLTCCEYILKFAQFSLSGITFHRFLCPLEGLHVVISWILFLCLLFGHC